jgi:hypothetical protein
MRRHFRFAALMQAAIEQPEYEGKTFGAVSLIGGEQAIEIDGANSSLARHLSRRSGTIRGQPDQHASNLGGMRGSHSVVFRDQLSPPPTARGRNP